MAKIIEAIEELESDLEFYKDRTEKLEESLNQLENDNHEMRPHYELCLWADKAYPKIMEALDKRYQAIKDVERKA